MNNRIWAGLALSATMALAAAGCHEPSFTEDEKQTLRLFEKFDVCRGDKIEAMIPEKAQMEREILQEARKQGRTLKDDELNRAVTRFALLLASDDCVRELKIDRQDFTAKVENIQKKHGAGVFSKPAP